MTSHRLRLLMCFLTLTSPGDGRARGRHNEYKYCAPCACRPPYTVLNCRGAGITGGIKPTDHYIRSQIEEILLDGNPIEETIDAHYWELFPKLEFISYTNVPPHSTCLHAAISSDIRLRGTVCAQDEHKTGKFKCCFRL